MQYPTLLLSLAAIFLTSKTLAQEPTPQVNFYSDTNCATYIGHEYPSDSAVTGGPAGSKAIIWVNGGPPDNPCCGSNEYACKNSDCSVSDQVKIGQCKPFESGVWAKFECLGGCE